MFSFAKCTDVCLTICVVRTAELLKLETAGVISDATADKGNVSARSGLLHLAQSVWKFKTRHS